MKKIKNICVVTGTRADYGIYYPLLEKLEHHPTFNLKLLVTGMHLSPTYGFTVKEIEKDGFDIIGKVDILLQGATHGNMARSIAYGIIGMTQIFESYPIDLVITLGDRGEMLAASIAASHLNIPVAHLHGGEVSGSIDESVRHAITKLSHIHFPATEKSAERIKKLGEDEWRVHPVGALRIDTIVNSELPRLEDVKAKYGLEGIIDDYFLLVFHPVTSEYTISDQVYNIVSTLLAEQKPIICILPNSDAGTDQIISSYKEFEREEQLYFVTNFSHLDYLTILRHSLALVGNSSSGIIEAASFLKPVINIGSRQNGRERSGNVIDVQPTKNDIRWALNQIKSYEFQIKLQTVENVYGDGKASTRIIKILEDIEVTPSLLQKKISY
jgi:GDP/UDP-N,N'-diacetylbacillosamine 2-epimerase (hydrolysing)